MKVPTKDKCSKCKRFMPIQLRHILCSSCKRYLQSKCSTITVTKYHLLYQWKCQHCIQGELPFTSVSDDDLKLTLNALSEPTNLNMKLLPNFSVNTLLNKIPGQPRSFSELSNTKTSSNYHDITEFGRRNFKSNSSFNFFHINIASLPKHRDELSSLLNLINYKFKIIGISETRLNSNIGETINIEIDEYHFIDKRP